MKKRSGFRLAAEVLLVDPVSVAAQTPPFDPVGRWRFLHTDGSPFIGRLTAAAPGR